MHTHMDTQNIIETRKQTLKCSYTPEKTGNKNMHTCFYILVIPLTRCPYRPLTSFKESYSVRYTDEHMQRDLVTDRKKNREGAWWKPDGQTQRQLTDGQTLTAWIFYGAVKSDLCVLWVSWRLHQKSQIEVRLHTSCCVWGLDQQNEAPCKDPGRPNFSFSLGKKERAQLHVVDWVPKFKMTFCLEWPLITFRSSLVIKPTLC